MNSQIRGEEKAINGWYKAKHEKKNKACLMTATIWLRYFKLQKGLSKAEDFLFFHIFK